MSARLSFTRTLMVAAAVSLSACGGLIEQLQSEQVAIAALIRTPDAKNPETEEVIPGATSFTLFFGTVDRSKLVPTTGGQDAQAGAFKGNAGATVTLLFKDAGGVERSINPQDKGEGQYAIDSTQSQLLTYNAETLYTLNIVHSGKTYRLTVEPPTSAEIAEFKAAENKVVTDHPAGAPFTVTRADASTDPSKNALAFVNLMELSGTDQSQKWSNMPTDALGFLRLVLADSPWRARQFTVPGDQFAAGSQYLVTLSSLERGESDGPTDGSAALFPGSSFLAGVADAGGILTEGQ